MHMAEQQLTKVTLNLFTEDVEELKRLEGYGYQIKVRYIVHNWLHEQKLRKEGMYNAKL